MIAGNRLEYKVGPDNKVRVSGMGFDGPVIQVFDNDDFCIWRITGATAWAGRGSKAYYPTEYWLMAKTATRGGWQNAVVVEVVEPGRLWKRCLWKMIAFCKEGVKA